MKLFLISFLLSIALTIQITAQEVPDYVDNQLLVKFSESAYSTFKTVPTNQPFNLTTDKDINELFTSLDVAKFERLHPLEEHTELGSQSGMNREFVINYSKDIKVPDAIIIALRNKNIEMVTPNHIYYMDVVPNDQYYSNQWALPKIEMPNAWSVQLGLSDIRIAILDVGFKLDHPDLSSKFSTIYKRDETDIYTPYYTSQGYTLITGEDYVTPDNDPTGKGTHGTHVSGISAASTNNSTGISGVGWNNLLVPVRCGFQILDPQSVSKGILETDDWIRALDWVRNNSAAKVVNMSFGRSYSGGSNPLEQNAINNALNAGIIICASSGNSNESNVGYPAAYSGVISVGASNQSDNRCSPSDWGVGSGSNYGPQLSIVAPGNYIYSTSFNLSGNSIYEYKTGTSMAAPHVAGAAGLILSLNPYLSPAEVKNILQNSATKVAGMGGQNFHVEYGYGRLNVYQALLNTPLSFQFVNNIQDDELFGKLVIDNSINFPITSGSYESFTQGSSHQVRTDELPFILNWSGTTMKGNRWYLTNSVYNLNLQFTATTSERPKKVARFEPTEAVTIQNTFEGGNAIDQVQVKDPWYYYKDQNNNWFQSNEFKNYSSPLTIQNNSTSSYGGVFLNQPYTGTNPVHYSVKRAEQTQDIALTQTGKTHRFHFQNWSANPLGSANFQTFTNLETPIVFLQSGATVSANLKGTQLSGTTTGFSNSSQRKIVTTFTDYRYHIVYLSAGSVWYEKADVNSETTIAPVNWQLMNGAKPLNGELIYTEAKSPSIDYVYATHNSSEENYFIYIVYQKKKSDGKYEIRLSKFNQSGTKIFDMQVYNSIYTNYSSIDCTPVVGVTRQSSGGVGIKLVVLWKMQAEGSLSAGLYYVAGFDEGSSIRWTDNYPTPYKISTTDINSLNPTIAAFKKPYANIYFHLAYQQGTSQIKYVPIIFGVNGTGNGGTPTIVSSGSGSPINISPSITVGNIHYGYPSYENTYDSPKLVWCSGDNGEGIYRSKSSMQTSTWSPFNVYIENDDVQSPTISGPKYHPTGWDDTFYFGWTWLIGNYKTYVSTNNLSLKKSLSYKGKDFQIANNMEDWDGFGYVVLDNVTRTIAPFTFENKWIYPTPSKLNFSNIHSGRAGTVIKNEAEFYFAFGDITLNDNLIGFNTLNDTTIISTLNDLTSNLISVPFQVNNNNVLTYSIFYGLNDSSLAFNSLAQNDQVSFQIDIIDAQTQQVLGTIDNVIQTKQNLTTYEVLSNQVNLSGIGNREIKLALKISNNFPSDYSLSNIYSFDQALGKANKNIVNWDDTKTVKEYALEQNFPNPFNPSTKIRFQIPNDGFVTLKVYDILGNEVLTLINEQKSQGKYEVNFNASNFASGVYIYKIQSGDFVSSKKMILLK